MHRCSLFVMLFLLQWNFNECFLDWPDSTWSDLTNVLLKGIRSLIRHVPLISYYDPPRQELSHYSSDYGHDPKTYILNSHPLPDNSQNPPNQQQTYPNDAGGSAINNNVNINVDKAPSLSDPTYQYQSTHADSNNNFGAQKEDEIKPNTIVECVGNNCSICSASTICFCTSNGAIMCVVNATSTEKGQPSTTVSTPCISIAIIFGDLVKDAIIVVKNMTDFIGTPTAISISTLAAKAFQMFCVIKKELLSQLNEDKTIWDYVKNIIPFFG